jgi:hypothetical protein
MVSPSLVVVLAEDRRQQEFIRRFLTRLYSPRQIRLAPLPSGGSGEQWVRKHYSIEVKAFRTRAAKAKTALIVAIDADTGTVDTRQRQLAAILDSAEIKPRLIAEPIVYLIPKRNVETWILCLTETAVEEETD